MNNFSILLQRAKGVLEPVWLETRTELDRLRGRLKSRKPSQYFIKRNPTMSIEEEPTDTSTTTANTTVTATESRDFTFKTKCPPVYYEGN